MTSQTIADQPVVDNLSLSAYFYFEARGGTDRRDVMRKAWILLVLCVACGGEETEEAPPLNCAALRSRTITWSDGVVEAWPNAENTILCAVFDPRIALSDGAHDSWSCSFDESRSSTASDLGCNFAYTCNLGADERTIRGVTVDVDRSGCVLYLATVNNDGQCHYTATTCEFI